MEHLEQPSTEVIRINKTNEARRNASKRYVNELGDPSDPSAIMLIN